MILLVTPSRRAEECAAVLEASGREKVQISKTLKDAMAYLRRDEFSVVVVDETLLDQKPGEGDLLTRRLGTAMPVYVNLGVSGVERVTGQVRTAMRRWDEEHLRAMRTAEAHLRSELRGDLTALLLLSEMALAESVPDTAAAKIKSIRELAIRMRSRLRLT